MGEHEKYIPALGVDRLTPLFDPFVRWSMRELELKRRLINQAHIEPGQHVLDLGCGTATLTILIKQMQPGVEVVGLDGDPKILAIAEAKAVKADVNVWLDQGLAFDLPYPDRAFERVVSSLVIHHLTTANKQRTFKEIQRVLRPGGELHILDFGPPYNYYTSSVARLMWHFEEIADNLAGALPEMLRKAGLEQVKVTQHFTTVFGPLALYRAQRSS